MVASRICRLIVAAVAGLGLTASASAQRLQFEVAAGPTWRGVQSGARGPGFDAVTMEAGVTRRLTDGLTLRSAMGMTVGTTSENIAVGAPCDPSGFCPGGGRVGIVIPGHIYHGRAGVGWLVPGVGDRFEARAGVGIHRASVRGPDAVLGMDAGVSAAITPCLHVGVDATRFTSDLGLLRWLVAPAIQLRLPSGGR